MGIEQARNLMEGFCNVCSVCNGKGCPSKVPGMGGAGTGASFRANLEALAKIRLNMKVFKCTRKPLTKGRVLGLNLDFPVLASPVAGVPFNMSKKVSEEDYINAVVGGCFKQGILSCVGDGLPDNIYKAGYNAIKKVNGCGIPFIKPWDDKTFNRKIEEAKEIGTEIIGIDVDAIGLSTINMMGASIPLRTPKEYAELIKKTPFKIILKGIMDAEEARMALEIGADAIVVSNHGGRVLDYTKGTADVLQEIVKEIKGQIPVLVDGGVRTGTDVLKMLALGADAVMIGRPVAISVFKDMENGVKEYFEGIKADLVKAMILTGCDSIADINPGIISY